MTLLREAGPRALEPERDEQGGTLAGDFLSSLTKEVKIVLCLQQETDLRRCQRAACCPFHPAVHRSIHS
jgi:hypothetical protein